MTRMNIGIMAAATIAVLGFGAWVSGWFHHVTPTVTNSAPTTQTTTTTAPGPVTTASIDAQLGNADTQMQGLGTDLGQADAAVSQSDTSGQ